MRRTSRNALLTAAAVGVLLAVPVPANAGPCVVCDAAADAADGLLGGILPDPLKPYGDKVVRVIRTVGDEACTSGAGGPVDEAHQTVCQLP